jgi:hypothetical protein
MADWISYTDIPQNGFRTVQLPRPAIGVLVENNTNVTVTVLDDMGKVIGAAPPGLTLGWNAPQGLYSPQVGCLGAYQGNGRVYFYPDAINLSNNPPAQQPPGDIPVTITGGTVDVTGSTITVTGGTVNIGNIPTMDIRTMPGVNISTIPAINVNTLPAISGTVTSIPFGTTPVSGTFIDPNVATNTGALLGLLTRYTAFFTLSAGQTHTEATANAIAGFGLTATIVGAGRLNVWVNAGAQKIYLVRDRGFYASPLCTNPVEKRFAIPIAAGDSIGVSWDDATTNASFVLRY